MAYHSLTILLLISAPSDIPDEDMATIKRTLSQWNLTVGRSTGLTVLPVSWTEHAASEFGERPQEIINDQLVIESDMVLALFADRLGTPTGEAESGTAEEIERMLEAGKHVSVLVNAAPRAPLSGAKAIEEKGRLEEYLGGLRSRALVLRYSTQADLIGHVNNMLSRATAKVEAKAERPTPVPEAEESRGVWPYLLRIPYQETDNKGRLKSKTKYRLQLRNTTGRPVYDVSYSFPEGTSFDHIPHEPVESLPPDGTLEYPMMMVLGGESQATCTVTWHYAEGEPRESVGTISV